MDREGAPLSAAPVDQIRRHLVVDPVDPHHVPPRQAPARTERIPVLGTEAFLVLYYLGCSFVVFLVWACVCDAPSEAVHPVQHRRVHRLAVGLAVAGLLHPAVALAGRDLARQMGPAGVPHDLATRRTIQVTTWFLALALVLAAVVVLSQVGPLRDLPILRQIAAGLPYA